MRADLDQIAIRTAFMPGDIGAIIQLHGEVYCKEYNFQEGFEFYVAREIGSMYNLNYEKHCFWIAEVENQIIGFICLMDRDRDVQLRFFIVHKIYRGIGLGKKLISLCMQEVQNSSYINCYLWTTDLLPIAIDLYESYGFQLVETREDTSFGSPLVEMKYELKIDRHNAL